MAANSPQPTMAASTIQGNSRREANHRRWECGERGMYLAMSVPNTRTTRGERGLGQNEGEYSTSHAGACKTEDRRGFFLAWNESLKPEAR